MTLPLFTQISKKLTRRCAIGPPGAEPDELAGYSYDTISQPMNRANSPGARSVDANLEPAVLAEPLFCARCSAELQPGAGTLWRVTIDAVADPWPPAVTGEETAKDLRAEIEQLLAQMEGLSAQEAMDQVHRRLVLCLCGPCYRYWIENPAGPTA
jgi:hypothetical protein